jgi:hypothetical protein
MAPPLQISCGMKKIWLPVMSVMVAAGTSAALPPNAPAHLRPGANHNTGDDGFAASQGRAPKAGEERLRMREHFLAVRAKLAAAKATRPELEAKRKKILGHLDAYIAKGTTPLNSHLPWRTPVFIDDDKTICAVGYLIEQTAGRAVADKIAETHRYSFIEDIARDMPEVAAWVAESGFTLEELGRIQPGYEGPDVLRWQDSYFVIRDGENNEIKITDGTFAKKGLVGMMKKGRMDGAWVRKDDEGNVTGKGTFSNGSGPWTSFHANGQKLAEGAFTRNIPTGAWRFYHASGNLAAEGSFSAGQRAGAWSFYYDTAKPTLITAGKFAADGKVSGTWKHFDAQGKLLATTREDTPEAWTNTKQRPLFWNIGYLVDVVPGANRIQHQIHTGAMEGGDARLDALSLDGERVYVKKDRFFDGEGNQLVRMAGSWADAWRADDCGWSGTRKKFARRGDASALNGLIYGDFYDDDKVAACKPGALITGARAKKITAMVASMEEIRSASPAFMTKVALGEEVAEEDLPESLAASMTLDVTWPHVDGRFNDVYATLPGYARPYEY